MNVNIETESGNSLNINQNNVLDVSRAALEHALLFIELHDPSSKETFNPLFEATEQEYYDFRNDMVMNAVMFARNIGYKAGYQVHQPITDMIEKNWDYRWGVIAFIELPTGQISWHLESPDIIYDGHGYQEKHERIQNYLKGE
jgi:hypothetical protein